MATNSHNFLGNLISLGLVRVSWRNLYIVPFAEMLKRNFASRSPYIDVIRRNVYREGEWGTGLQTESIGQEARCSFSKPCKILRWLGVLDAGVHTNMPIFGHIGTFSDGWLCYHSAICVFGYDELPRCLHTDYFHGWSLLCRWNRYAYFRSMGDGPREYIFLYSSFCLWFVMTTLSYFVIDGTKY